MKDLLRSETSAGRSLPGAGGHELQFQQLTGERQGNPDAETAALRETLNNFRMAVTELAGDAPALCLRMERPEPARGSGMIWRMAAGVSFATAVVVAAVSIALAPHRTPVASQPSAAVQASQTPRTTMSDEALLASINQDLSTSVPVSLAPLAIQASTGTTNGSN